MGIVSYTRQYDIRLAYGKNALLPFDASVLNQWLDQHLLFESTTLNTLPCVLTGRKTKGVQAQRPADRIASYDGARLAVSSHRR